MLDMTAFHFAISDAHGGEIYLIENLEHYIALMPLFREKPTERNCILRLIGILWNMI